MVLVNKDRLKHTEAAAFKTELMKDPDIISVAAKNSGSWGTAAKVSNDSTINFAYETVDESYLPELKIPIVQGRNFSKTFPSDSAKA